MPTPTVPCGQLVYGYGNGLIVYLILEQQKRIVVERVLWLEDLG